MTPTTYMNFILSTFRPKFTYEKVLRGVGISNINHLLNEDASDYLLHDYWRHPAQIILSIKEAYD